MLIVLLNALSAASKRGAAVPIGFYSQITMGARKI
jgi:hypothetical protein